MQLSVLPRIPSTRLLVFAVLLLFVAPGSGAPARGDFSRSSEADGVPAAAGARSEATSPAATVVEAAPAGGMADAEAALRALAPRVERTSHPEALRMAFQAYYNYKAARPDRVRKPYLFFVDFGLDNRTPRGYVFDMEKLTLVDGPFSVAHGSGSSRTRNAVPTTFSNRAGSKATSLGLYVARQTYTFNGRAGGRAYRSVGLRLEGESGAFNSAALRRGIVSHGAPYVTSREAGRSEGCPAMERHRARRLLPMLSNGGVVFHFSPHDERWLRGDPWVNAGGAS